MGFFNLEDCLKKYNIDTSNSALLCINGGRNTGKTTGTFNWLFGGDNPRVNSNNKLLIIRNTGEQIKVAKQDFNSRMFGRYQVWGGLIYKLVKQEKANGDTTYGKGEHIGYIGSLSQFTNMKSVEAKDIRYVLFDEYAEHNLMSVYDKFITMLKTFERFNRIFVIMIGNRETLNNEWMLKWGVLPELFNFKEDRYVQFSPRGHFLELGSDQFADLENEKTLSNELAGFDSKSNAYLNEDMYKHDVTLKVKSFSSFTLKEVKFGVCFEEIPFALIELKEPNMYLLAEEPLAIQMLLNKKLSILSFDKVSYTLETTEYMKDSAKLKLVRLLVELYKNNQLYFDSFNGLEYLKLASRFYEVNNE